MNTRELEQQMKQLMEEQEYAPADASWERMYEALHPPATSRKLLFLLPVWKAAAAVALLLSTGLGGYFLLKEDKQALPATVAKNAVEKTQPLPTGNTSPSAADVPEALPRENNASSVQPAIATNNQIVSHDTLVPTTPQSLQQETLHPAGQSQIAKPSNNDNVALQNKQETGKRNFITGEIPSPNKERKNLDLGLAANIGKPSLGNVQYNVGVVARKDITGRIFAEANVSLASTQVNYSERLSSSDPGFTNLGSDYFGEASSGQDVALNYSNNIISVGFAPSIGIKATGNISLSVGGDVYKSLNRDLKLKSDQMEGLRDVTRIPGRTVTDWDAGIKAQFDYKLGQRFSVNTQYRQGLTQYILVNGKSVKNSIFNIGLKYYIGK